MMRLILTLSGILVVSGFATTNEKTQEAVEHRGWFSNAVGACVGSCAYGSALWYQTTCTCNTGYEDVCCDKPTHCRTSMDALCPRSMLDLKSAPTAVFDGPDTLPMRIGTAPLPVQARGVFWLRDQGDSSSLMSFAQSNDGQGISPGTIPADGKYKIRVCGDRTWSFADESFNWEASQAMDLIYTFNFDNATDPKNARVIAGGGSPLSVVWTAVTLALDFALELMVNNDGSYTGAHETYATSVVWDRPSRFLGQTVSSYQAVQIINEHGEPLQPAFNDWKAYNMLPETGNTPGTIYYFEAECEDSDSEASCGVGNQVLQ